MRLSTTAIAVVRYPYTTGQTQITAAGVKLCDLPGGPIDHHWTKSLTASPDGSKLYAGVGSNSNITENGIQAEVGRAAIWEIEGGLLIADDTGNSVWRVSAAAEPAIAQSSPHQRSFVSSAGKSLPMSAHGRRLSHP
jgi:glucose/arabinose dehydrogenase